MTISHAWEKRQQTTSLMRCKTLSCMRMCVKHLILQHGWVISIYIKSRVGCFMYRAGRILQLGSENIALHLLCYICYLR